jgi:hypothetical protein
MLSIVAEHIGTTEEQQPGRHFKVCLLLIAGSGPQPLAFSPPLHKQRFPKSFSSKLLEI